MVAMLETATNVKAFSVGKPSPYMMRAARKELGLTSDQTTMIGDTMETDILGGVQLGYHTVLVLSGGTRREALRHYAYQPDVVVESIAELHQLLERSGWMPIRTLEPGTSPRLETAIGRGRTARRVAPDSAIASL
jgi:NagD protein